MWNLQAVCYSPVASACWQVDTKLTPSPMAMPAAGMSENTPLYSDRPRRYFPRTRPCRGAAAMRMKMGHTPKRGERLQVGVKIGAVLQARGEEADRGASRRR